MLRRLGADTNLPCARACFTDWVSAQNLADGHSTGASQCVWHFGSGPGPTQVLHRPHLAFEALTSSSLGRLKEGERNRAGPTIPESWVTMSTWTWRPRAAVPPWCALGPQSRCRFPDCAAQPQVVSLSSRGRRRASGGPVQPSDR